MSEDLFSRVLNPTDNTFLEIRDHPVRFKQRDHLQGLWEAFEPYADRQFLDELGHHFYSRYWEMWVGVELLKRSLPLTPMNERPSTGPDFLLNYGGENIWIEAVAPDRGRSNDSPTYSIETGLGWVPEEKFVIRHQGAIAGKVEKHQEYIRKGIVQEVDPYVIAVYGGKFQEFEIGEPLPYEFQAVASRMVRKVIIDINKVEVVDEYIEAEAVTKRASGNEVPANTFLTGEYACVSALITGHPHPIEINSRSLLWLHNPTASNPLSEEISNGWPSWFYVDGRWQKRIREL